MTRERVLKVLSFRALHQLFDESFSDLYKPSIVLDFKGTKVGIIGFVTKDTPVSEHTSR